MVQNSYILVLLLLTVSLAKGNPLGINEVDTKDSQSKSGIETQPKTEPSTLAILFAKSSRENNVKQSAITSESKCHTESVTKPNNGHGIPQKTSSTTKAPEILRLSIPRISSDAVPELESTLTSTPPYESYDEPDNSQTTFFPIEHDSAYTFKESQIIEQTTPVSGLKAILRFFLYECTTCCDLDEIPPNCSDCCVDRSLPYKVLQSLA